MKIHEKKYPLNINLPFKERIRQAVSILIRGRIALWLDDEDVKYIKTMQDVVLKGV